MKCFHCLVDFERGTRDRIRDAEYIYDGRSLCFEHAQTVRVTTTEEPTP